MELENKVILIAGASTGIGKATALALSRMHNKIVIVARRKELLSQVAAEIEKNGSEALAVDADALDEAKAAGALEQAVKRFGRIDAALLNIGAGPSLNIASATPAEIKGNMRINYDSMINFFSPIVQQMKKQQEGGIIANTNSLAGFMGLPTQGQYSAAKAACRIFLDTARLELKRYNIRVLTICPGFVITERNKQEGVPKALTMSLDEAAENIVKALRLEIREYLFPPQLARQVRLGNYLPAYVRDRMLSKYIKDE